MVEDLLEVVDGADVQAQQVAVLAGDALALDDLGRALGELGDLVDLAGEGAHADHRGQREADGLGIDDGPIAGDDALALEAPHALGHRRRGQADAPPELGEGDPSVALELFEQTTVDLV